MKKSLLFLGAALLFAANVSAENPTKVFTADEDLTTWWVNGDVKGGWDIGTCEGSDGVYGIFTHDLEEGPLAGFYWATDLKFEEITEQWADLKENLHLNFWYNSFDGANTGDTIWIASEIVTPEGGKGWPGVKVATVAGKWNWVSIDLSQQLYSELKPSEIAEASLFKFSPQMYKSYEQGAGNVTMAFQNISISKGAAALPATDPCGNATGDPGTSVTSIKASKASLFYPNPANGSIYINGLASGQIIDITGKIVASFSNASQVDISAISQGVYFVKAGNQVEKLVVK